MSKERKGLIDKYEKFNWATMVGGLIIGGSVGTTLALFDAIQIAAIRMYKNIKKKK